MLRSLVGLAAAVSFYSAAVTLHAQAPSDGAARAAAAKKPSAASSKRAVKRTPWGDPDLQGTWDYRTITPLERPQNMGDRQFLTDAEAATLEARAAKRLDEPPDESVPANTIHAPSSRDTTTTPSKASSGNTTNPASKPWSARPAVNPAECNAAR